MNKSQYTFFTHLSCEEVTQIISKQKHIYSLFSNKPEGFVGEVNDNKDLIRLKYISSNRPVNNEINPSFHARIASFENGNKTGTLIKGEIRGLIQYPAVPLKLISRAVLGFGVFIVLYDLIFNGFNIITIFAAIAIVVFITSFMYLFSALASQNSEDVKMHILKFIKNELQATPYVHNKKENEN